MGACVCPLMCVCVCVCVHVCVCMYVHVAMSKFMLKAGICYDSVDITLYHVMLSYGMRLVRVSSESLPNMAYL
jgi:hypothetical protein